MEGCIKTAKVEGRQDISKNNCENSVVSAHSVKNTHNDVTINYRQSDLLATTLVIDFWTMSTNRCTPTLL